MRRFIDSIRLLRKIFPKVQKYIINLNSDIKLLPEGQEGIEKMGYRFYVGGLWNTMGDLQLNFLLKNNLQKHHVLLDIGCGSLRAGIRIIPYLNKGNYLGIDKEQKLINAGIKHELGVRLFKKKKPELVVSNNFEFSKFSKKPDYAIAQSLFTHLNKSDINTCMKKLRSFVKDDTLFYATFFESGKKRRNPRRSHAHKSFLYTKAEMLDFGRNNNWEAEYIGDWSHPRGQVIVSYVPIITNSRINRNI